MNKYMQHFKEKYIYGNSSFALQYQRQPSCNQKNILLEMNEILRPHVIASLV